MEGLYAWNGGFPCGIDGLRVRVTDAARSTTSGQGEGRTAISAPSDQDAYRQEGHRMTRRLSNNRESIGSDQQNAEWLRVCPVGWQMFWASFRIILIDNTFFILLPLYAIFDHFMQIFTTWNGKEYFMPAND